MAEKRPGGDRGRAGDQSHTIDAYAMNAGNSSHVSAWRICGCVSAEIVLAVAICAAFVGLRLLNVNRGHRSQAPQRDHAGSVGIARWIGCHAMFGSVSG